MSSITTRPMVDDRREIRGWAMYDWANSAFSTTVGTVFLGPYVTELARAAAGPDGMARFLGGLLGVAMWRDVHFYFAHRLLHGGDECLCQGDRR